MKKLSKLAKEYLELQHSADSFGEEEEIREYAYYNKLANEKYGKRTDDPVTLNLQNSLRGKAYHEGDEDLSSGHDWGAASQTITIKVDGGTTKTVTLNSATTTAAEVVTEIITELANASPSAVTGIEIYTYLGLIGIRRTVPGTTKSFEIVGGTAITTLGWTAATYTGTYTIDSDFQALSTDGVLTYETDFNLAHEVTEPDKAISNITGSEYSNQIASKYKAGLLFVLSESDRNNLKNYVFKCDAINIVDNDVSSTEYDQADTSIEYQETQVAYNTFISIIKVPYEVNIYFPNSD